MADFAVQPQQQSYVACPRHANGSTRTPSTNGVTADGTRVFNNSEIREHLTDLHKQRVYCKECLCLTLAERGYRTSPATVTRIKEDLGLLNPQVAAGRLKDGNLLQYLILEASNPEIGVDWDKLKAAVLESYAWDISKERTKKLVPYLKRPLKGILTNDQWLTTCTHQSEFGVIYAVREARFGTVLAVWTISSNAPCPLREIFYQFLELISNLGGTSQEDVTIQYPPGGSTYNLTEILRSVISQSLGIDLLSYLYLLSQFQPAAGCGYLQTQEQSSAGCADPQNDWMAKVASEDTLSFHGANDTERQIAFCLWKEWHSTNLVLVAKRYNYIPFTDPLDSIGWANEGLVNADCEVIRRLMDECRPPPPVDDVSIMIQEIVNHHLHIESEYLFPGITIQNMFETILTSLASETA